MSIRIFVRCAEKIVHILDAICIFYIVLSHYLDEVYINELTSLITDSTCQLQIFGHNGNSSRMNSAQIGILVDPYKITLGRELEKL